MEIKSYETDVLEASKAWYLKVHKEGTKAASQESGYLYDRIKYLVKAEEKAGVINP